MSAGRRVRPWVLCVLAATGVAVTAQSQGRIIESTLVGKKRSADQQMAALAVPFTGVRTAAGVTAGLFPVRATGVSTEPVRVAADAFLASLTGTQAIRTVFAVDDAEWRRWSNVDNGIYVRQGVSVKEMSEAQRQAAMALMRASLSAKGLALTEAIRKTDQTLRARSTTTSSGSTSSSTSSR